MCRIINSDKIQKYDDEPEGEIVKILGETGIFKTEMDSVLYKYNLSDKFNIKIEKEVSGINYTQDFSELKSGRIDLREEYCFTIDPEDAKDYDDAVSIKKLGEGYLIGVHISDVSFYVRENTQLNKEALKRGTSVYLPDKVIPMLPFKLSNDICSLIPNQDRLAFSVIIKLNKRYFVQGYEVVKSVIRNKRRFSYGEADDILNGKKSEYAEDIKLMDRVAKNLNKIRLKQGSIDFDSREVKFKFDKRGNISNIEIRERTDSMRLIEEFMLLANRCVTEYVATLSKNLRKKLPFIYRVHDLPDGEKLSEISDFITQFGYSPNLNDKESINKLLSDIKGKPEEYIINELLIRSMAKAKYAESNIGHYGLGFKNYTHFTSPIRRYPDLIVHRILSDYINNGGIEHEKIRQNISHYQKILPEICRHCSVKEQEAVSAEREGIKLFQIEYIKNSLGNEFEGIISGLNNTGLFIQLNENLVEGFVRFSDIEDDYYVYDERNHRATGRKKKKTFHAGMKVKVKLINADLESKRVDFIFV